MSGGGVPDAGAAWIHHDADKANAITQITKKTGSAPDQTYDLVYDLAGNLVLDGTYFQQYDGFNPLFVLLV